MLQAFTTPPGPIPRVRATVRARRRATASGSSSLKYGPEPSAGTIVYDPKANGGWKSDPFHNVPRDLDAYVLAYGKVIRTGVGGYEVRALPTSFFLNNHDTPFRGNFEVGSKPLNTGQPGHFVTHRHFRP